MKRSLICLVLLALLLGVTASRCVEVKENENSAVITVRAGTDTFPNVKALVCNPKIIQREGLYDLRAHVKRLEGDNCAFVTFRCGPDAPEGAETKICLNDRPVDTGCKTAAGLPILVEVTSILK